VIRSKIYELPAFLTYLIGLKFYQFTNTYSATMIFRKFNFKSVINKKGPEPQFVISALAPAPGAGSSEVRFEPELLDPYPILELHIEILRSLKC
jgi:hypothetical protein